MRYLLLSDIHANEEALGAVLGRVRRDKFDAVVALGDLVGYGASPNQVLDRLRKIRRRKVFVRGNHDRVACGLDSGDSFSPLALRAARWTARALTSQNKKYLETLPSGPLTVDGSFEICHGSPRDEDAYILSEEEAILSFRASGSAICFFGHSHIPSVFAETARGVDLGVVAEDGVSLPLQPGQRYLINPGSVGQPRDRNPAASYALYDAEKRVVHFHRVPYDIEKAREKIRRAGLPAMLGDRLQIGA